MTAPFRYEGIVRDLVMRAKAKNDLTALRLIGRLMTDDAAVGAALRGAVAVVPAPSSAWSRWRGRFCIPEAVARALARRHGIPVVAVPWPLHWRWRKNARMGRGERVKRLDEPGARRTFAVPALREGPVVILDDVVTTGSTMAGLARDLGLATPRFVAFASAIQAE